MYFGKHNVIAWPNKNNWGMRNAYLCTFFVCKKMSEFETRRNNKWERKKKSKGKNLRGGILKNSFRGNRNFAIREPFEVNYIRVKGKVKLSVTKK